MSNLNVLVTAASRRVPLVQAFQQAQRRLGLRGDVIVTDVNPLSPAVHVVDRAYRVPMSDSPGYVETILAIAVRERVGLVVPTIDDELPMFGGAIERFAAHGIAVAASPRGTAEICNDKFATCQHLRARGVAAAESWLPAALPRRPAFPVFVKPRGGRGSVGAFMASTPRELDFFLGYVADPVVQEFLAGPEFTIDLFCDFGGRPLSAVPRERVVIRSGVIDRGRTVNDPLLIRLALDCAAALAFRAAVNIQCRVVCGTPTIFEINPRFSGGIPLTIAAGADFPEWLLQMTLGRAPRARIGEFTHDLWMTCYESAVFLDARSVDVLRRLDPVVEGVTA